jgi:hypothetical protein
MALSIDMVDSEIISSMTGPLYRLKLRCLAIFRESSMMYLPSSSLMRSLPDSRQSTMALYSMALLMYSALSAFFGVGDMLKGSFIIFDGSIIPQLRAIVNPLSGDLASFSGFFWLFSNYFHLGGLQMVWKAL